MLDTLQTCIFYRCDSARTLTRGYYIASSPRNLASAASSLLLRSSPPLFFLLMRPNSSYLQQDTSAACSVMQEIRTQLKKAPELPDSLPQVTACAQAGFGRAAALFLPCTGSGRAGDHRQAVTLMNMHGGAVPLHAAEWLTRDPHSLLHIQAWQVLIAFGQAKATNAARPAFYRQTELLLF